MKLTKKIWNDFLNEVVDASGKAGWDLFEEKHGFTYDSFEKLLLDNQEKAEKWDSEMITPNMIDILIMGTNSTDDLPWTEKGELDMVKLIQAYQENKRFKEKLKKIEKANDCHVQSQEIADILMSGENQ